MTLTFGYKYMNKQVCGVKTSKCFDAPKSFFFLFLIYGILIYRVEEKEKWALEKTSG